MCGNTSLNVLSLVEYNPSALVQSHMRVPYKYMPHYKSVTRHVNVCTSDHDIAFKMLMVIFQGPSICLGRTRPQLTLF